MTVLNIMNFVRATEPRLEMDLFGCLEKQLACLRKYGLRSTLLLQYDALINEDYRDLIKQYEDILDVGIWLEMVRPLCEKAGVEYHGREGWDWDHHANATFAIGYDVEDRYKLLDVEFEDFKKYFGKYPNIVGSWIIDAKSLLYMKEKYGICGSMNCVEQMGIDGYTLWGGYPANAYYPSIKNAFCPANDKNMQIKVPVFRFSGMDITHYYGGTHIYTLEPAGYDCGGDKRWTTWFYKQAIDSPELNFSYIQTGQENSFGWARFGKGFEMQCQMIVEMQKAGKIKLQTMTETSKEFIEKFSLTPVTTRCFFEDWSEENKQSVWYMSRFYRASLIADEKGVRIRDIFRFDQNFQERYLDKREKTRSCIFTNLEVFSSLTRIDGREPAGYLNGLENGRVSLSGKALDENTLEIVADNGYKFIFEEKQMSILTDTHTAFAVNFLFRDPPVFVIKDDNEGIDYDATRRLFNPPSFTVQDNKICFQLEREDRVFNYEVKVLQGKPEKTENGFMISARAGEKISLYLAEPGKYE